MRRRNRFDPTGVGARLHQLATSGALAEMSMVDIGQALREQLEYQTLPSWCRITRDPTYGGFLLGAAEATQPRRREQRRVPLKQVVGQSRMIWTLASAHRCGIDPHGYDPVARATDGYRFLLRHLRDATHGGYFWRVTRSGEVENDLKVLYGQAFVIYALVELSRASSDRGPLEEALSLWQVVMDRLHDDEHGGWAEHAQRDWTPPAAGRRVPVERAGHKSADAHLHWMEALTELCTETGDPSVARSLEEVVDVLCTHFYPPDPAKTRAVLNPDWRPLEDANELRVPLGHNVEFARLLLGAEHALGRVPSTDRLVTYLDHALESGFDRANGGLDAHLSPEADEPRARNAWVQGELLATLADVASRTGGQPYERPLRQQLAFMLIRQIDPADGIWWARVDENGLVTRPVKHTQQKAGYHETRAITILIERSTSLTSRGE